MISLEKSVKITSCFIYFFLSFICNAQNDAFFNYGIAEGLSQEAVNAIAKDSKGFLWIGTQDGLNRFDGYSFKIYKKQKNNSESLSGNFINTLIEDTNQNLWIGTKNNGISLYNASSQIFEKIAVEGLESNAHCNKLVLDKNGIIYASFLHQGIAVIQKKNGVLTTKKIAFFDEANYNITALKIVNNHLFVGTREGQVFFTDLSLNTFLFQELTFNFKKHKIHSFSASVNGVFIGSDEGLFHFIKTEKSVIPVFLNSKKNIAVFDILQHNKITFLATDNGFYKGINYDRSLGGFKEITHQESRSENKKGLTSNRINCLLLDNDYLWLGSNKLQQLQLNDPVFNSSNDNRLNNSLVYSIYKDDSGLWTGTRNGLFLNHDNKHYYFDTTNGLTNNTIRSLVKDDKNNLWIGTQKGISIIDLNSFDPKKPHFITVKKHPVDTLRLSNFKIRDLLNDAHGNIWVATLGGGIHRFLGDINSKDFRFQQYKNSPITSNSLNTNVTYALYNDSKNTYWIGTENGLNKLVFKKGGFNNPLFTSYQNKENNATSLSNNTVLSFLEDSDGDFWIGTLNGLNKYNESANSFKVYAEENGLTNTVIYAIVEDENKLLWVSTNSGLFSFDKNLEVFTNYNSKDGLKNEEFTLGAYFKDGNHLYFGGSNGFDIFNSKDIDKLDQQGNLMFTDLNIGQNSLDEETEITLTHDAFPFYLNFSDLDFKPYKNNTYAYKLLPNDNDWNDLKDRREIQFLELSAKTHQLIIQGKTRGKLWSSKPLTLTLKVTPPWWQTYYAYALYLLLLSGVIYAMSRFQLQRKLQQQETQSLKELNTLKTKLYTNITHEFRTPITVIKGLASHLKEQSIKTENPESISSLNSIERNSDSILKLVNQMLDLAKIDKRKLTLNPIQTDLIWYLEHLVSQFSSYATSQNIALTFYSENKELLMDFDPDALQKIIYNLLSNAVKYCEINDQIVIHVKSNELRKVVIINVKDSGKGIKEAHLPYIFDRFYQIEDHNEYSSEGSGIGLTLTKELIELMQGSISVQSEEQNGTTFSVELPIYNKAIITHKKEPLLETIVLHKPIDLLEDDLSNPIETEQRIVLIVDDNEDILKLLQLYLKNHYKVIVSKNGLQGVQKAIEIIPDVIVSDIMMPETNGYTLCKTLKEDERTSHIPIILLTAKSTDQDKIKGLSHGADAFITKPFNKAELFIRIQELIKIRDLLYKKYASASSWDAIENEVLEDKDAVFMNKVLFQIEQHLEDATFNSSRLAKKLALSESQLYRKLKAITNTSTANFIRKVRLQKAKILLQSSEKTVSEIAYQSGFNSPGWFSRAFKEEFGYSPNDTRK